MKIHASRWTTVALMAGCIASLASCYPVYPRGNSSAYNTDSKGYEVASEPVRQPPRYAVDPGLAIAGVAAAGLLGYAIGNNHGYHNHYYGPPVYYRPAPYGRAYYGRRYHP
jgi:hypothetical protein